MLRMMFRTDRRMQGDRPSQVTVTQVPLCLFQYAGIRMLRMMFRTDRHMQGDRPSQVTVNTGSTVSLSVCRNKNAKDDVPY